MSVSLRSSDGVRRNRSKTAFAGAVVLISLLNNGCGKKMEEPQVDTGLCSSFDDRHRSQFEISADGNKIKRAIKTTPLVSNLELIGMSGMLPPTSQAASNQIKLIFSAQPAVSEDVVFDTSVQTPYPVEIDKQGIRITFTLCGYKFEGEGVDVCTARIDPGKKKCTLEIGSDVEFK